MKQNRSIIFALIVLVIASLACSMFAGGSEKVSSETDKPQEQETNESQEQAPQYKPGYEPGWRIFSNANYVNGLTVYEGTLWLPRRAVWLLGISKATNPRSSLHLMGWGNLVPMMW